MTNENQVNIMVVADLHLKCIGPNKMEIFNEEIQMRRCFQIAVQYLKPDLVFIVGDIFDTGVQHCNSHEFDNTIKRFENIFSLPNGTSMYVVPGNRDVGYHHQ